MLYKNQPLIECIKKNKPVEIRVGEGREKFTKIWVVNVGDRLFARSWDFSAKSWYHTFLVSGKGELKCGDKIFKVKGFIPKDLTSVNPRVSSAYLAKYDEGENSYYARKLTQSEHDKTTIEFELIED